MSLPLWIRFYGDASAPAPQSLHIINSCLDSRPGVNETDRVSVDSTLACAYLVASSGYQFVTAKAQLDRHWIPGKGIEQSQKTVSQWMGDRKRAVPPRTIIHFKLPRGLVTVICCLTVANSRGRG
jgi:hypothetical protein